MPLLKGRKRGDDVQKKQKANLALAISAAGFLGTLPAGGFWGGLLHHGFLAATVGGLADWFAVTAIFSKPLGISYRTDILRRNRQRIMDALVTFASDDLLSVKNIMQVVRRQDVAQLLVAYLEHRGGRERLVETVDHVAVRAVNTLDSAKVAGEIETILKDGLRTIPIERVAMEGLRILAEEQYSCHLIRALAEVAQRVLASPVLRETLKENVSLLRKEYEGDSAGRAFVLSSLGLTDERIVQIICERMEEKLGEVIAGETPTYAAAKAGLETLLRRLSQDPSLLAALQAWKTGFLRQVSLLPLLVQWIDAHVKGEQPFWLAALETFLNEKIDAFVQSRPWQRRVDAFFKNLLEEELTKHHAVIPDLIRERLGEFSDDALVAMVESKVQDDLQMIRINGALVGSLVGMGLFILVTLAERMW